MNNPLVTILSPCYNVVHFLPKYFESILGQTYSNLQVVLIDDGSKDNTWTVMQEYAKKDSRVEVYHQENQGVAAARNELLKHIKGDYFLFVDSDDWIEPDMVDFLVARQKETGVDIVTCAAVVNDAVVDKTFTEVLWDQPKAIEEFIRHQKINGSLWNKLVKTSLLHNVKFHCGISYGEDALFCWGILQYLQKLLFTDKQLYHYRMNEGSISHQSFGPKKLSGHETWKIICAETEKFWPNYIGVAHARWAVQDIQLVRDAAHCNYPYDSQIEELQRTVKKYWLCIVKENISTIKMRLYSFFACRSYWFAKLF